MSARDPGTGDPGRPLESPAGAAAARPTADARPGRFRGLGANYWKLWASSTVSNLGDGVSLIAFPWLATVLTDDAFLVALMGVATRLPWLVFSLPAGAIADRLDRRRIMIAMNAMRGAVVGGVAVLVHLDLMSLPLLYLAALLLGVAEVLFDNTSQVILPAIVRKDQLEAANGNLMGAQIVTNEFVGHPLGGVLTAAALALPFAVDAATAVVSVALLLAIRGSFRVPADAGAPRATLRADIVEGLRWLWRHPFLRPLAITLGWMNATFAAGMAIFVLFAQEILGLGAVGFGIITTAFGVGGFIGSLLAARVSRRIGQSASLFVTLWVAVGGLTIVALSSSPVLVGTLFAVYGFSAVLWNVITVSLRQTIIPDRLLGRVNSVYRLLAWGSMPFGMTAGGALVSAVEQLLGRGPGLRAPFLAAALVNAGLLVYARGRLSQRAIDDARAAAGA
jgi:MFS family permease